MGVISNILKKRRKELGLTLAQIADKMGVSEATVQRWESGNIKNLRQERIGPLAEILQVSPAYLMGWDETEPAPDSPSPETLKVDNLFTIETKKFPLLGRVACGAPIFADGDRELYVEAGANIKADFCLRARGDSMIGARIQDGDIVFIHQQEMVEDGEIAAVLIEDEATLKRVQYNRSENELLLFAENPKYKTMRFTGEELNHIRILGKAVAFQSDVK